MDWDVLHYDIDLPGRLQNKKMSAIILAHICIGDILKRGSSNHCNRCSGGRPSFRITNLEFQKRKATETHQRNKKY